MIEIKAKRHDDDRVDLRIKIAGPGKDIIAEFSSIMMEFPRQLCDTDKDLFKAATEEFRLHMERFAKEAMDEYDNQEVCDGTKQS